MKVLSSLCAAAACCLSAVAQEPTEEELRAHERERQLRQEAADRLRDAALENLKAGRPLFALDWRRDAAGDLGYRLAESKDAPFVPWFGKGLPDAIATTGIVGMFMWFPHHGDVLSLTHGEHHLRRIGIGTATPDVASFARSPLPGAQRDLALLDRLVAIDLLSRRGDDDATKARSGLANDATIDAALRERAAAAKPERRRLDATTLALPERCDLVLVVNHERMFDGLPLAELGHFTGQLSTMLVLQMLKAPRAEDALLGEVESEFVTELPFELARRFGNFRLDHTVVALSARKEVGAGGWMVESAGRFFPANVVAGVAAINGDGDEAELVSGRAKAKVGGNVLVVTDRLATATSPGVTTAASPELAARVLGGDESMRVHVPEGSSLLEQLRSLGIDDVESLDATVSFDDPIVVDAVLKTKDVATAEVLATQLKDQVLRTGLPGILDRLALERDGGGSHRVAVDGSLVRFHVERPRSMLPTPAMLRDRLMRENLR